MKKSLGPKTMLYPAPVLVIGSYDKGGHPNVMTAAWGGICCSDPPCVAVSLRKATYTYGNIIERKAFTINIPSQTQVGIADYFGLVSGRTEDKFSASGFTAVKSDLVDAPYVREFPLVLECSVLQIIEIGLHTQFIGQVMDAKAEESILDAKDIPDMEKLRPFVFSPYSQVYFGVGGHLGKAFSIGRKK